MQAPLPRGTEVDLARRQAWINRFAGYRREVSEGRIRTWLGQFRQPDQDLAARTLDSVEFISSAGIADAFRSIHTKLEAKGWHHSPSRRLPRSLGLDRVAIPCSTRSVRPTT